MRQGLRLLRHGEPRGPQAVEGDGPGALGGARYLEYRALQGARPEHGVRPRRAPPARHGARFTRDFEDWVAWLAVLLQFFLSNFCTIFPQHRLLVSSGNCTV